MRDTTTVIILRKGARPKPRKLTGKQLTKHFHSQEDEAYEMMKSLSINPISNRRLMSKEKEWVDLDGDDLGDTPDDQEDPILLARRLLQTDKYTKRRNAQNREKLAQNWAKVRPMIVQYATERPPPECDCRERKEKIITIISLTGRWDTQQRPGAKLTSSQCRDEESTLQFL
jgi:hypothetical protein